MGALQDVDFGAKETKETAAKPTPALMSAIPIESGDKTPINNPGSATSEQLSPAVQEAMKEKVADEVTGQVSGVAERVAQIVNAKLGEQTTTVETAIAEVKEVMGQAAAKADEAVAQAKTEMTEQVAAVAETASQVKKDIKDQEVRHLIRLTFIQTCGSLILAFLLGGLVVYLTISNQRREDNYRANAPVIVTEKMPASDDKPLVIPDAYKKIVDKQTDTFKNKSVSDEKIEEAIGLVLLNNDKVTQVIQAKMESLKKSGLSAAEAGAQAFSDDNLVPVVVGELPDEAKNIPNITDIVRTELNKISAYAKSEAKSTDAAVRQRRQQVQSLPQ